MGKKIADIPAPERGVRSFLPVFFRPVPGLDTIGFPRADALGYFSTALRAEIAALRTTNTLGYRRILKKTAPIPFLSHAPPAGCATPK